MADIFLSYAREDLERARRIAGALQAEGWSVFWDRRIPPGGTYEDNLGKQIKESRVVVVLWSPHSVASPWVRLEAAHGRDRNPRALIPIVIAPAEIPFGFQHLQAADLQTWQPGDRGIEFEELLSSIDSLATRQAALAEGAEPPRRTSTHPSTGPGKRPPPVSEEPAPTEASSAASQKAALPAEPRARSAWGWLGPLRRLFKPTVGVGAVITAAVALSLYLFGAFTGRRGLGPADAGVTPPERAVLPNELVLPVNPVLSLIKIPAGPFLMGSDKKKDPDARADESWPGGIQSSVDVSDFYIGKYEVTVAQFKACADAKGCTAIRLDGDTPDRPVVWASWRDGLQYCAWLERTARDSGETRTELKSLLANGWRVSLPSEAEWEQAARGTDGRIYPWGDGLALDRANYEDAKVGTTSPVGSFPHGASPYGIFDMSGNVWEWTRSLHKPYPYLASDGREDLQASGSRVLRGGSFNSDERSVRVAFRQGYEPDLRGRDVGFRVVVSRF
jgi:formylglycine-generating enzyme required for sulfatase activity